MLNFTILPAYEYKKEIKSLFEEYTTMLIENDGAFAGYLKLQNYDDELEHLEKKYGLPGGRLYIAFAGGAAAGCVAIRKIDGGSCELKRLYVRPQFRYNGLGRMLLEKAVGEARAAGYKQMLLDTLPFLQSALKMYRAYGFYETEPHGYSPMATSIYMRLDLK